MLARDYRSGIAETSRPKDKENISPTAGETRVPCQSGKPSGSGLNVNKTIHEIKVENDGFSDDSTDNFNALLTQMAHSTQMPGLVDGVAGGETDRGNASPEVLEGGHDSDQSVRSDNLFEENPYEENPTQFRNPDGNDPVVLGGAGTIICSSDDEEDDVTDDEDGNGRDDDEDDEVLEEPKPKKRGELFNQVGYQKRGKAPRYSRLQKDSINL